VTDRPAPYVPYFYSYIFLRREPGGKIDLSQATKVWKTSFYSYHSCAWNPLSIFSENYRRFVRCVYIFGLLFVCLNLCVCACVLFLCSRCDNSKWCVIDLRTTLVHCDFWFNFFRFFPFVKFGRYHIFTLTYYFAGNQVRKLTFHCERKSENRPFTRTSRMPEK